MDEAIKKAFIYLEVDFLDRNDMTSKPRFSPPYVTPPQPFAQTQAQQVPTSAAISIAVRWPYYHKNKFHLGSNI
jgi:hypothetical protein